MKTERRHELQTNELADHLGRYLQAMRPYQNLILIGVVAAVAIVGGVMWLSSQRTAKAQAAWSDYFRAMSEQRAESLEDMATFHHGSTAALWAQQSAGDINLATGAGLMFQDREEAETKLKDAEKNFQAVEEGAGEYPDLLRRARFGLAQVYETLSDVSKARDYYEQVAGADPESPIGKLAAERLDRLSDPSIERWYNWFERQEPTPPTPPGGPGLGDPLGDLEDLPETPDLSFPSADPLDVTPGDEIEVPAGPTLAPADQPVAPPTKTEMPAEPKESTVEPGDASNDPADDPEQPPGESAEPAESSAAGDGQENAATDDAATGGDEPETP